jgi:hypothetical protein
VTDPLSDQPMTEADLRAVLARMGQFAPFGIGTVNVSLPCALARECLRLRGLLAEAAVALGPFAGFAVETDRGGARAGDVCPMGLYFDRLGGRPNLGDCRQAAAVAARVRGHLGELT